MLLWMLIKYRTQLLILLSKLLQSIFLIIIPFRPLTYFISQGVTNYGDGLPVNTVIFAGSALDIDKVNTTQTSVNTLAANGNTVTVVLVDPNIDQTNYKKVTGLNIVVWSDSATTISNLEANMKCSGATPPTNPTTQPTSTTVVTSQPTSTTVSNTQPTSTTVTTQLTSTVVTTQSAVTTPSTVTTQATSTATSGQTTPGTIPAYTCKSYIPFSYDVSSVLSSDQFSTLRSFILNPFLQPVFPMDLQPAPFSTYSTRTFPVRRLQNVSDIISYVTVDANQVQDTTSDFTE